MRLRLPRVAAAAFALAMLGCADSAVSPLSSPSTTTPRASGGPTVMGASYSLRPGVRAEPDFIGPGAAGVCPTESHELVSVTLEIDVPNPRCAVIKGSQRLRVTNHTSEIVHAVLGPLEMVLPPGSSLTIKEEFRTYLEPGGHTMTTDFYSGGTEFRLEEG